MVCSNFLENKDVLDNAPVLLYYLINTTTQGGEEMSWQLKDSSPIYLQLTEEIKKRIVSGMYEAGAKLPSVRDLASEASVNPNTMQRALAELERYGLVYTNRTSGRFITEDESLIKQLRVGLAKKHVDTFLTNMEQLGFSYTETLDLISELVSHIPAEK